MYIISQNNVNKGECDLFVQILNYYNKELFSIILNNLYINPLLFYYLYIDESQSINDSVDRNKKKEMRIFRMYDFFEILRNLHRRCDRRISNQTVN